MKKNRIFKTISGVALCTVLLTGCSESWLEPKPLSFLTPENAYVDADGLLTSLAAAERSMRHEYFGNGSGYTCELIFSDLCISGTTDKAGPLQDMDRQLMPDANFNNAENSYLTSHNWDENWNQIKYTNVVLSRMKDTKFVNEAEKNKVLGTGYFQRCYRYWRLINQFGDVPFIDVEVTYPRYDFNTCDRWSILRRMKKDGKSIIIITHKLHEVMSLTDRVAVLRKGEYIGTVDTKSATEQSLTEMMVGKKVSLNIERTAPVNPQNRIELKNVTTLNAEGVKAVDDISFDIRSGEILGIAGIAGSGQRELLETIAGLQKPESGEIFYHSPEGETVDLKAKTPTQIKELGVRLSFVPEDRLGMGLVGNMDIIDNMMLRSYKKGNSAFLDRKNPKKLAEKIIESLEVVTPGATTPVRRLSGGNVQKVLVGREIAANPKVLMAAYPVRGLDINSSYTIYNLLTKQKENGVAVVFVGEDLDVLVELCDRIMVINSGKITGMLDGRNATKEEIGLLMTKTEREDS